MQNLVKCAFNAVIQNDSGEGYIFIFQRHGNPYNGKILSEVGHVFECAGRMGVH